jgi:hypothetical protein
VIADSCHWLGRQVCVRTGGTRRRAAEGPVSPIRVRPETVPSSGRSIAINTPARTKLRYPAVLFGCHDSEFSYDILLQWAAEWRLSRVWRSTRFRTRASPRRERCMTRSGRSPAPSLPQTPQLFEAATRTLGRFVLMTGA